MWFFFCDQWGNTFFRIKMTNGFSGKSQSNKFLLLILLVFLSNRFKLKSEVNVINRNINLWKKKLNFESEYKGHKSGENPNLGLRRVHEIVWNIWKLKKIFCVFGFADWDICCTLRIISLINSNNKSNKDFQYCIIFFCTHL